MFHPRVLFRTLLPVLALVLLLAGCIMPARDEPPPAEAAETGVGAVAEPEQVQTVTVTTDANVRAGPGTDHAARFWLPTNTEVVVTGRNADGTWLQIEHEGRTGWIFGALTDIGAEALAALPDTMPADMTAAEPAPTPETVAPTPEPTPEPTVEPTVEPMPEPEPTPAPATATQPTVTVTGTVVNLRRGPGTEHPTDGQVRAGDQLQVTGRNADGNWLRIMHPAATGEQVWIYGPLTDIDAATVQTLAEVGAIGIEVATPPEPEPAPGAEPEQETPAATLPDLSDCTQWHTVNANEIHLEQITDWYGLNLAAVAALNGMEPDAPLVAGEQICLAAGQEPTTQAQDAATVTVEVETPAATPTPEALGEVVAPPPVSGDCRTHTGQSLPCPDLPDNPDFSVPNAPIGQKVVDSPLGVLWHAPGSYSRDLPGLDYDFEMVFSDDSAMWNWTVRDFDACYDAVRVHMDTIPREVGLQRLEVRLSDPVFNDAARVWLYGTSYDSPWANPAARPWSEWPNWTLADAGHPDLAVVYLGCYSEPFGQALCRIYPEWGNSHSIHLNAAATLALANSIAGIPMMRGSTGTTAWTSASSISTPTCSRFSTTAAAIRPDRDPVWMWRGPSRRLRAGKNSFG